MAHESEQEEQSRTYADLVSRMAPRQPPPIRPNPRLQPRAGGDTLFNCLVVGLMLATSLIGIALLMLAALA
jgi:hypothetical protein